MLIAKVVDGVTLHLRARWFEWVLCAMTLNFGATLLLPAATFSLSSSFNVMSEWASETVWGLALTVIGVARLIALLLNGTFKPFKVVSPYVRASAAALSAFAWFCVSFGVYESGNITPGGGTYGLIMFSEIIVCWIVSLEAGAAERAYRNGSKSSV